MKTAYFSLGCFWSPQLEFEKIKGVKNMKQRPTAVFLFQTLNNENIIREANILNIPVIALVETSTRVKNIEYPVPLNTQSMKSVYLFCQLWWASVQKKDKLE